MKNEFAVEDICKNNYFFVFREKCCNIIYYVKKLLQFQASQKIKYIAF